MGDIIEFTKSANNNLSVEDLKRKAQNRSRSQSSQNKRNIKNKPAKRLSRRAKRILRGTIKIGALALSLGIAAGTISTVINNVDKKNKEENIIVGTEEPGIIATEELSLEDQVENAKEDFLTRYLEGYNKMYNTNITIDEVELSPHYLVSGYVYKVDGNLVTPGQSPAITKAKLAEVGDVEVVYEHEELVQILRNTSEGVKVLGTYDANTLEAMYSGTDLDLSKELAELYKLGISPETAMSMFGLVQGEGHEPDESIQMRVDRYKSLIQSLEKSVDEGFEIDD